MGDDSYMDAKSELDERNTDTWPVIDVYKRSDAIADGVLVDVSDTAAEAGISVPVAITAGAWADCVEWNETIEQRKPEYTGQDETGRLWDVLWMLTIAARQHRAESEILFQVLRVPAAGRGIRPRKAWLRAVAGPGDTGEPVITILLPDED